MLQREVSTLILIHWRSQKFWLGGPKMEKFCDVFRWHNGHGNTIKRRHNWYFEIRFRYNQLEKTPIWPHHED